MKLIDLIPYIEEALSSTRGYIKFYDLIKDPILNPDYLKDPDLACINRDTIDELRLMKKNLIREKGSHEFEFQYQEEKDRSERLLKTCESSMEIVINGIHYELGNFEERHFVNSSTADMAQALMAMKIGMPYDKFSIGFSFEDSDGTRIPVILTVETVKEEDGFPFSLIVPWAYVKNSWIQFPAFVPIVCFSKDMNEIIDDRDSAEDCIPEKLGIFFDRVTISSYGATEGEEGEDLDEIIDEDEDFDPGIAFYTTTPLINDNDLCEEDKKYRWGMSNLLDKIICDYFLKFIYLLNTKGVSTKSIPASLKLNKKRIKRNKRPFPDYKVLQFNLPKEKTNSHKLNGHRNPSALHTCAGHTKFYSSENPLFGHYVGPVWCPQHLRGDKKYGVITKDYELKKKKDKSNM